MKRRDFIKATAAISAGAALTSCTGGSIFGNGPKVSRGQMQLRFAPYELQLQHTFTVSSYSRTTTPDVLVEIEYDGLTGYGEASMPPYLNHTVEEACAFLSRVDLSQFADPMQLEDILDYVNSLSEGDEPAKAAIDIAWLTERSPLPIFADESLQHLADIPRIKGAFSAAAQLSPAVDFADLDGNLLISNDKFKGMTVVDGKITLPDWPGIGIRPL